MDKEDQTSVRMKKPATEEDCKAGRGIFYISDNRSKVYDLGRPLPLAARYKQDTPTSTADQQETILQEPWLKSFNVRSWTTVRFLLDIAVARMKEFARSMS